MSREVEGIGKTYDEAVKDGLQKIGLSKKQVNIEEIKEHKKTFFNILEPRVVKVKITQIESNNNIEYKNIEEKTEVVEISEIDINQIKEKIEKFLDDFINALGIELSKKIEYSDNKFSIELNGEKAGLIIGYRGETLEALQVILNNIVIKNSRGTHIKVIVDAENYRGKRIKTLGELAIKEADRVVVKRKSITLEPMAAFERKAIHTALQDHPKVKTSSIGEEPYRKVIISLK